MKIEEFKFKLEEADVEPSLIEELVRSVSGIKVVEKKSGESEIEGLKTRLLEEGDWVKRAKIAARIISLGLE